MKCKAAQACNLINQINPLYFLVTFINSTQNPNATDGQDSKKSNIILNLQKFRLQN